MSLEKQLRDASSKDQLHRIIDAMPEGEFLILVGSYCFDVVCAHEDHTPVQIVDYSYAGDINTLQAVGALEFTKLHVYADALEDEDEE